MRTTLLGIFSVYLLLGISTASGASAISGAARIIDGDTIEIAGTHIRLFGIDAPESSQMCRHSDGASWRCGQASTDELSSLIGGASVSCVSKGADRYGRTLGVCSKGDLDLNAQMVGLGFAIAYRHYSEDYVHEEDGARAARRGMWNGEFVEPWNWRKGARLSNESGAQAADAGECRIKGNINRKGAHIYHLPGDHSYDRTLISIANGERWFCSEAEAIAAGWHRARQ